MLDLMTVKFLGSYQTRPMHLFGGARPRLHVARVRERGSRRCVMKYTTGPGMTGEPAVPARRGAGLIGVQFVSLGLMGEVLTRVYFESQGKRPYTVREKRNIGGPVMTSARIKVPEQVA